MKRPTGWEIAGGVGGSVPIFATLAEAEAWEAKNPGKKALTLEPSTPDTTAPSAGALTVTVKDKAATGIVSGATDDRAVTGYAFRVGSGAWSAWQASPTFEFTGLSASTPYWFQHQVRDAAGNVTVGTAVSATTLAVMPITDDYTYQWLGSDAGGATWVDTKDGLAAPLSGAAPVIEGPFADFSSTAGTYGPVSLAKITTATPTYMAVWQTTADSSTRMGAAIGSQGAAGALGIYTVGGGAIAMQAMVNGIHSQGLPSPTTGPLVNGKTHIGTVRFASGSTSGNLDGMVFTQAGTYDPAAVATTPVYLAEQSSLTNFIGKLAEVRIYNRRLTDAEVTQARQELAQTYGVASVSYTHLRAHET